MDAIHWNDRGALIITESCTGCGACVPACPYDAVHLVSSRPGQRIAALVALAADHAAERDPRSHLQPHSPSGAPISAIYAMATTIWHASALAPPGALRLMPVEELFPL